MNIGKNTIDFCMAITCDHTGQRIINNKKSEVFKLGKGVRQGNPMSPLLFVLGLEPTSTSKFKKVTKRSASWQKTESEIHSVR